MNHAGGALRIAAAVVGAIGALIEMLKGLVSCFVWAGLGIRQGTLLTNTHLHTVFASNALLIASCILALIGALLVGRGRYRSGTALLLGAAAGMVVAVLLYALLVAVFAVPLEPAVPAFPRTISFYVVWLGPVPLLLVAAALAFLTRGRLRPV